MFQTVKRITGETGKNDEPVAVLEKIVELVGGQSEVARRCNVRQANVWNWLNRDKRVPAECVIPLCAACNFQVTPHELRPDIYPERKDGLPAEQCA